MIKKAPRFQFGNVVVIDGDQIGVICKTWTYKDTFTYGVYVRSYNNFKEFLEEEVEHFIYSEHLNQDEYELYDRY